MVFLLKAMRGLTADTGPVSMCFFSFMHWHSKRAAWSGFHVPSRCLTIFKIGYYDILCFSVHRYPISLLTMYPFLKLHNWNKWIQNSTVHKIQWHPVKYSRALLMIYSVSFFSCHSASYHGHDLKIQQNALNFIKNLCHEDFQLFLIVHVILLIFFAPSSFCF